MGAGLTAAERTRRAVAVTVAEAARTLRSRGVPRIAVSAGAAHGALMSIGPDGSGRPSPAPPAMPEEPADDAPPVITITIAGPSGAGKSVVAHLVRDRLAHEGIACRGPDGLRSIAWRRAVAGLIERGLSVELVKVEAAAGR